MIWATSITASLSLLLGFIVLWANPRRFTNQIFSVASLLVSVWLILVRESALTLSESPARSGPWLRANAAVAALAPWAVWTLKESLLALPGQTIHTLRRSARWALPSLLMIPLALSDSFVDTTMLTAGVPQRGWTYVLYSAIGVSAYLIINIQMWKQMTALSGIKRIEMQSLAAHLGIIALVAAASTSIGNLFHIVAIRNMSVFLFIFGIFFAAWSLAYYKVFDIAQIAKSLSQYFVTAVGTILSVVISWRFCEGFLPPPQIAAVTLGVGAITAYALNYIIVYWLDLNGARMILSTRKRIIDLARSVSDTETLVLEFEQFLSQTLKSKVTLLFENRERFIGTDIAIDRYRPAIAALTVRGSATPEELIRRRSNPDADDLIRLMRDLRLGLIACSPRGSHSPSLILTATRKENDWPFTEPDIKQILSIIELIDNILTRSRLSTEAALRAKIEHLAIMSRGIAHDLKNLITPISSYLIHAEHKCSLTGPEAEVHLAAKHSVRVMTDYIAEAQFFSSRLSPKLEHVDLKDMTDGALSILLERAEARGVTLDVGAVDRDIIVADKILMQRVIVNLVSNALDASPAGTRITVSGATILGDRAELRIADQGTGIAPEDLPRVFEPYFTTKQFGDEVRGFGLGLTICQKIVHLHQGTIEIESTVGRGTTVIVRLPRRQPIPAPAAADASAGRHASLAPA